MEGSTGGIEGGCGTSPVERWVVCSRCSVLLSPRGWGLSTVKRWGGCSLCSVLLSPVGWSPRSRSRCSGPRSCCSCSCLIRSCRARISCACSETMPPIPASTDSSPGLPTVAGCNPAMGSGGTLGVVSSPGGRRVSGVCVTSAAYTGAVMLLVGWGTTGVGVPVVSGPRSAPEGIPERDASVVWAAPKLPAVGGGKLGVLLRIIVLVTGGGTLNVPPTGRPGVVFFGQYTPLTTIPPSPRPVPGAPNGAEV